MFQEILFLNFISSFCLIHFFYSLAKDLQYCNVKNSQPAPPPPTSYKMPPHPHGTNSWLRPWSQHFCRNIEIPGNLMKKHLLGHFSWNTLCFLQYKPNFLISISYLKRQFHSVLLTIVSVEVNFSIYCIAPI